MKNFPKIRPLCDNTELYNWLIKLIGPIHELICVKPQGWYVGFMVSYILTEQMWLWLQENWHNLAQIQYDPFSVHCLNHALKTG